MNFLFSNNIEVALLILHYIVSLSAIEKYNHGIVKTFIISAKLSIEVQGEKSISLINYKSRANGK